MLLRQSTARNRMVLMIDNADHVSGKTGLTLTISLSKDGGGFNTITPTVTERGSGWYSLAYTTGHTDTLGDFALHVTGGGADPTDILDQVVGFDPGDGVHLGLTALPNATAGTAGGLPLTVAGLRKNTAFNNFQFRLRSATDHVAGKTGLIDASFVKQEIIDGGPVLSLSGTVTEAGFGLYRINLTAAELNGDEVTLRFAASGADDAIITLKTSS